MFSALIIDADQGATDAIEAALASYEFDFTTTENAPEAMSLARTASPDIIFLRVELPSVSGFSVCNKLRRNSETRTIPLVMYSSDVTDDVFDQHRGLKTHADEYLKLPFADAELVAAVSGLVSLPEGAGDSGVLEVEIDDDDDDDSGGPSMEEFDQEFAEIDGESSTEVGAGAGSGQADIGDETEAAFDALTLEEGGGSAREQVEEVEEVEEVDDIADEVVELDEEPAGEVVEAEPEASRSSTALQGQREVLQLKTQLNAKNREILALKDDLESQERAVLDAKHKNRELQVQIGDLEEKLLGAQEQTITAQENAEAASTDKATALKREEGIRSRLDSSVAKAKELEGELLEAEQRLTDAESKSATAQAHLVEQVKAIEDRLEGIEIERDSLKGDLEQSHQQVAGLNERIEASAHKNSQLSDTVAELESDLTEARRNAQQAEESHQEALAKAAKDAEDASYDHERKLTAAHEQGEADKVAALKTQAEEHQAELEFEETQHQAEAERLRSQMKAAADGAAEELRQVRDEAQAQADALNQRVTALEADVRQLNADLEQSEAQLEKAHEELRTRRDAERRAQQALAVALRVLDGHSAQ